MENAVVGKPAIRIEGFEDHATNTANIHFRDIRLADRAAISVKDCTKVSFQDVRTVSGRKPAYRVENADDVSY